jgi:hypothetical protein
MSSGHSGESIPLKFAYGIPKKDSESHPGRDENPSGEVARNLMWTLLLRIAKAIRFLMLHLSICCHGPLSWLSGWMNHDWWDGIFPIPTSPLGKSRYSCPVLANHFAINLAIIGPWTNHGEVLEAKSSAVWKIWGGHRFNNSVAT